ncbi:MAG TPA: CGNR zinc finger domain-containing protein [Thermoanaerobaculia bacterium]|nr:CGNR zinc finger domain-containing protein [Thermoanaerobaculia bacterium]
MPVRHDFLILAGDPALDLLNTEVMYDGAPIDLLPDRESLVRWLSAAGLDADPGSLLAVKRLRYALRIVIAALADGRTPRRASMDLLADELQRGRGALVLHDRGERYSLEFETPVRDARYVLARAAASFLASADLSRIRRCGGTGCILFFYDATRSGTRRWCSMAGCGNRMKAATHYRRHKNG